MKKFLLVIIFFFALQGINAAPAPAVITYPSDHPRFAENIEVLKTALDRTVATHGPYEMKCSDMPMEEARYFAMAEKGVAVNVVWGAATVARQKKLIPIMIPLGKGLLGYRIGLINAGMQDQFNSVRNIKDLSAFTFGLGYGWGEVSIYRAAGLKVITSEYETQFKRLNMGSLDFLSRGVNEIWDEFSLHSKANPKIAIEQSLLLHSIFPYYFFVSPHDRQLAERIESGMRLMIADGSFDRIFHKHNSEAIVKARMNRRRIIEIPNPDLPPDTPLDPALWYSPGR